MKKDTPDGWSWVELGELAKFQNGYGFSKEQWTEEGRPIIRIQNLTGTGEHFNYFDGDIDKKYRVEQGDILLSWSATLDVFRWEGREAVLNQHIYNVTPYENTLVDSDFIYWLLKQTIDEISSGVHGSTMKHITKSELLEIEVPLPPLPEQRAIADSLNSIFEKLSKSSNTHARAKKIEEKLLSSCVSGLIPNDAGKVSLGALTNSSLYGSNAASSEDNSGIPLLRISDIDEDGRIDEEEMKFVQIDSDDQEKYKLQEGDLLIARSGATAGKNYLYDGSEKEMVYASYLIRFRLCEERVLPAYVSYYLRSSEYWNWIEQNRRESGAGAKANINATELKSLEIPLPPISKQGEIVERLRSLEEQVDEIREASGRMSEILDEIPEAVLDKAFRGELVATEGEEEYREMSNERRRVDEKGQVPFDDF